MTPEILTPQQVKVLDFEAAWQFRAPGGGAKEAAIAATFGLNTVAYYQVLNRLLDSQAALARHPQLINRLRRVRDSRMSRFSSSARSS